VSGEEFPATEEQANSLLIEAESSFEAGLIEVAAGLYMKASGLFTKLASTAKDEVKLELYLTKAAYSDFMRVYCEAIALRSSIDEDVMMGREVRPDKLVELKHLTRLADKCLREAVKRAEKLKRPAAENEELGEELAELLKMVKRKTEGFLDFKGQVEHL